MAQDFTAQDFTARDVMARDVIRAAEQRTTELEYYDTPTMMFHWLTVALVVLLMGTSLVWNYWTPHDRYWRPLMEGTHVSVGILFAVLIVGRVIWRLLGTRAVPAEVGLSGILSRAMYIILYILLVAEIILGFALRWFQGEEFQFFGLFSVPALLAPDKLLARQLEELHNWASWAIIVLASGHAIAALFHHYVLKDAVMRRMLYHRDRANSRLIAPNRP